MRERKKESVMLFCWSQTWKMFYVRFLFFSLPLRINSIEGELWFACNEKHSFFSFARSFASCLEFRCASAGEEQTLSLTIEPSPWSSLFLSSDVCQTINLAPFFSAMEQQLSSLNTDGPIEFRQFEHCHPSSTTSTTTKRHFSRSLSDPMSSVWPVHATRSPLPTAKIPGVRRDRRKPFSNRPTPDALARCWTIVTCPMSIRWDIQADSTRLPMMCKLWMIGKASVNTAGIRFLFLFFFLSVDGAVVERGKPHLVQDAAVQVFTAGRNRRMILAAEQRLSTSLVTTFDRRRRQSWHDVNEYHSVPYYQYTRAVPIGSWRERSMQHGRRLSNQYPEQSLVFGRKCRGTSQSNGGAARRERIHS